MRARVLLPLAGIPALHFLQCVGVEPVVTPSDSGQSAADGGLPPIDASGGGDSGVDGADAMPQLDAADSSATGGQDGGDAAQGSKQAFVTADAFDGRFDLADGGAGAGGVAAADQRCNEAASAAFPGRTFAAWLATSGGDAPSRIGAGPWYVGATLLGGKAELTTGALATSLDKTPQGTTLTTSQGAWTGTDDKGALDVGLSCSDWTIGTSAQSGEIGTVGGGGTIWTAAAARTCDAPRHLYCFEK
jgi:hypothetical protein